MPLTEFMPNDFLANNHDIFSVVHGCQKKMSEFYDILTFSSSYNVKIRESLLSCWRGLKIFNRLCFGFLDLLLNFALLCLDFPLVLRDDEDGKKAQNQKDERQCPCCFLKEIGCFSDTHKLVGAGKIRCKSTAF